MIKNIALYLKDFFTIIPRKITINHGDMDYVFKCHKDPIFGGRSYIFERDEYVISLSFSLLNGVYHTTFGIFYEDKLIYQNHETITNLSQIKNILIKNLNESEYIKETPLEILKDLAFGIFCLTSSCNQPFSSYRSSLYFKYDTNLKFYKITNNTWKVEFKNSDFSYRNENMSSEWSDEYLFDEYHGRAYLASDRNCAIINVPHFHTDIHPSYKKIPFDFFINKIIPSKTSLLKIPFNLKVYIIGITNLISASSAVALILIKNKNNCDYLIVKDSSNNTNEISNNLYIYKNINIKYSNNPIKNLNHIQKDFKPIFESKKIISKDTKIPLNGTLNDILKFIDFLDPFEDEIEDFFIKNLIDDTFLDSIGMQKPLSEEELKTIKLIFY